MTIERIDRTSHEVVRQLLSLTSNQRDDIGAKDFLSLLNKQPTASELGGPPTERETASDVHDHDVTPALERENNESEQLGVDQNEPSRLENEEVETGLAHARPLDHEAESVQPAQQESGERIRVRSDKHDDGTRHQRVEELNDDTADGDFDDDPATRPRILPIDEAVKKSRDHDFDRLDHSVHSTDANEHSKPVVHSDESQVEPVVAKGNLSLQVPPPTDSELRISDESELTLPRSVPPVDQRSRFQQRIDELQGQSIPGRESTLPVIPGQDFDPTKPLPSQARPGLENAERTHAERKKEAKVLATTNDKVPSEGRDRFGVVDGTSRDNSHSQKPISVDASRAATSVEALSTTSEERLQSGTGQASLGTQSTSAASSESRVPIGAVPSIGGPTHQGRAERSATGTESIQQAQVRLNRAQQRRLMQRVTRAFRVAQNRGGEIRIRLSPPELGAMKLQMKMSDNSMVARITTETEAARVTLIDNLPQLRDRLAEHGFEIERFDVEQSEDFDQAESGDQNDRRFDEHARSDANGDATGGLGTAPSDESTAPVLESRSDQASWPSTEQDGINVVV